MDLFRKILVPLELSELDERIMHFVAGHGPLRHRRGAPGEREARDRASRRPSRGARSATAAGSSRASPTSSPTRASTSPPSRSPASPVEEILRAAHEERRLAHRHRHARQEHAERVRRRAASPRPWAARSKVPVLMVPYRMLARRCPATRPRSRPGPRLLDRVVYPTDFSDVSERMLDLVKSLDGEQVGEVVVTHIVDPKELRAEHQREAAMRSDGRILAAIVEELERVRHPRRVRAGGRPRHRRAARTRGGASTPRRSSWARTAEASPRRSSSASVSQNVIRMSGPPGLHHALTLPSTARKRPFTDERAGEGPRIMRTPRVTARPRDARASAVGSSTDGTRVPLGIWGTFEVGHLRREPRGTRTGRHRRRRLRRRSVRRREAARAVAPVRAEEPDVRVRPRPARRAVGAVPHPVLRVRDHLPHLRHRDRVLLSDRARVAPSRPARAGRDRASSSAILLVGLLYAWKRGVLKWD